MAEILKKTDHNFRISRLNTSHSKPYRKILHYLIGEVLGKGGFASVHTALEIQTQEKVAVKIINIQGYSKHQFDKTIEQVEIVRIIDHPNIVRIYQTFQDEFSFMIFMELIKGKQLFDYICRHGPLKEKIAAHIFHQIVSTVKYLHQRGIVHRDIKAQNVMVDENFNAKLIDFGLAKIETKKDDNFNGDFCGSPSYLAPQILQKKKYNGAKIDIWCLGVLLYVMLEGNLPFQSKNETKQDRNQNIKMLNWHYPIFSSPQAKQLYASIFAPCQQRISIEQILESSFFKKHGLKLNETSLQINKTKSRSRNVEKAISLTTQILNIPEQNVKLQIKEKQLGEVYSIYSLLLKKENLQNYNMEKISIKTEVNNSKESISCEGEQLIQSLKILKTKLQTIKIQKYSPGQSLRKGSQKHINQQSKQITNIGNHRQILQKYLKKEQKSNEKINPKILNMRQTLISKKITNVNRLNKSQLIQQSKINMNNNIKIIKIQGYTPQKINNQQIKRSSRN